ncbi:AAA family ATPase [Streptomyces sp. NPDC020794]|uniref:AAA family ATPase n=1 Tax=unclassified Streptomyces TaxID=2593676 RepID=UPI0036E8D0F8
MKTLAEAQRVWIVGGPGCGKSTLARALAERRGIPPVTLDALFWRPAFAASVEAFAHRADCVVWTDPPLRVTWPRLLRRIVRRWIRREELWGGVRETFWTVVGPRSILWYAVQVRGSQRVANQKLFDAFSGTGILLLHTRDSDVRSLLK